MKFLKQLVKAILQDPNYYEDIFLFPNKRSVLFFQYYLSQEASVPILLPYAKSLREFVFETTNLHPMDNFSLTFELLKVYHTLFHSESLENFFVWASTLLKDFEEIDFSNSPPKKVLANIAELQKIDEYVNSFGIENPSEYRKKFFYFWDNLIHLYEKFHHHTAYEKKTSYYGFALQHLNRQLAQGNLTLQGRNFHFIGFSDLQNAEITLIQSIQQQKNVLLHFDVDSFFLSPAYPNNEIAQLFRKIPKNLHLAIAPKDHLTQNHLEIELIPCNTIVEQFKFCQHILRSLRKENSSVPLEEYAIILNEKNHLDLLLNSLPPEIDHINITLGYPLKKNHLAKLVLDLVELKIYHSPKNLRAVLTRVLQAGHSLFNLNRDLSALLLSPTLLEDIQSTEFFQQWLLIQTPYEGITFLQHWIQSLHSNSLLAPYENEEIYHLYKFLSKLRHNLQTIPQKLDWKIFVWIFKQLLDLEFIPFSGRPLKGLQVMELTESQCLDFQYVFVMDANEGSLPKSPDFSSFIPMNIKRHYGLRTPEDYDARYAYLLYRLCFRSQKLFLFYNTQQEETRFLNQIKILFQDLPNIKVTTKTYMLKSPLKPSIPPIQVNKNADVLNKIKQKLEQGIAPTALSTYLLCPLKFYYQFIEGISPTKEYEEEIQADEFGNIAHEALEKIYRSFNPSPPHMPFALSPSKLQQWLDEHQNASIETMLLPLVNLPKSSDGKNFFLLKVITEILKKIVQLDKERAEGQNIYLYSLEQPFEKHILLHNTPIKLYGKIDRVELHDQAYYIIDYKSGKVGNTTLKTHFNELFSPENFSKHKEMFQILFYAMLLENPNNGKKLHAGIYSFRKLKEGLMLLKTSKETTPLNYLDVQKEFEEFVMETLQEILDPEQPFQQTPYEPNCRYCPFLKNCGKFHLL